MHWAASPVICTENTAGDFLTVGALIPQKKNYKKQKKNWQQKRKSSKSNLDSLSTVHEVGRRWIWTAWICALARTPVWISAGIGCSWAAEGSWHAPLSHDLARLRLDIDRARDGWPADLASLSPWHRAAVIC